MNPTQYRRTLRAPSFALFVIGTDFLYYILRLHKTHFSILLIDEKSLGSGDVGFSHAKLSSTVELSTLPPPWMVPLLLRNS